MPALDIRQKVVITTLCAVVSSIIIISVYALSSSREIILKSAVERELPAILGEVGNELGMQLSKPITVAHVMANNVDYKNFIRRGEAKNEHLALTQYLKNIKQEFNSITAFLVSAKSGNYFTPDGLFKTLSPSEGKDSWFYSFINSGKEYELSLDIDEVTKVPTLFINYLMTVDGRPTAVAGIGLSLESMSNSISQYKIGDNGQVFLVDSMGVIKLHPDTEFIGKSLSELGDVDAKTLLAKQRFASSEYKQGGTDMLLASRYLDDIGWYLVAQVPRKEILGSIETVTWSLVIMGLIIAVVFTLISGFLINRLISPFSEVANILETIGNGGSDLSRRLDDSRSDEVGRMASGYNKFVDYLTTLLQQVSETGNHLFSSVESIDTQAKQMSVKISEQVNKIEQVATAIYEMGATGEDIATSANNAAENAQVADSAVLKGNQSVQHTISSVGQMSEQLQITSETITELAEDVSSIDTVLDVIRGVSEQTNLLALNAAIEAARAGEQGRGFAVVADEVRTLASRSHDSAQEIRSIIEKLQVKTHEAVDAINKSTQLTQDSQQEAESSGQHLQSISENISIMNDMNLQIATATGEQSNVVGEINPHVTAIADISRLNSEAVQQTAEDCSNLRALASELNQLVSSFKFK